MTTPDLPAAVSFTLGMLVDPLTEQLDGYLTPEVLEAFDLDRRAIGRLVIRGFITHHMGKHAYGKLSKRIIREITNANA